MFIIAMGTNPIRLQIYLFYNKVFSVHVIRINERLKNALY